ncbi:MAG: hypothetical protein V4490_05570, partial [Pseudomonadota bacterium]
MDRNRKKPTKAETAAFKEAQDRLGTATHEFSKAQAAIEAMEKELAQLQKKQASQPGAEQKKHDNYKNIEANIEAEKIRLPSLIKAAEDKLIKAKATLKTAEQAKNEAQTALNKLFPPKAPLPVAAAASIAPVAKAASPEPEAAPQQRLSLKEVQDAARKAREERAAGAQSAAPKTEPIEAASTNPEPSDAVRRLMQQRAAIAEAAQQGGGNIVPTLKPVSPPAQAAAPTSPTPARADAPASPIPAKSSVDLKAVAADRAKRAKEGTAGVA